MTPELATQRLGKLTASNAAVWMGGLDTEGLKKLVRQIAGERLFGDLGEEGYHSKAMDRGTNEEEAALNWFEFEHGGPIIRGEHVNHPSIPWVAGTPDGIKDGFPIEAKSPLFHIWCETKADWFEGKRGLQCVPARYRHQCRWQCWCLGVNRGTFVCYHPVRGGIVVPYEVSGADFEAMAKRVVQIEALIANWVEILKG